MKTLSEISDNAKQIYRWLIEMGGEVATGDDDNPNLSCAEMGAAIDELVDAGLIGSEGKSPVWHIWTVDENGKFMEARADA